MANKHRDECKRKKTEETETSALTSRMEEHATVLTSSTVQYGTVAATQAPRKTKQHNRHDGDESRWRRDNDSHANATYEGTRNSDNHVHASATHREPRDEDSHTTATRPTTTAVQGEEGPRSLSRDCHASALRRKWPFAHTRSRRRSEQGSHVSATHGKGSNATG